MAKSIFVVFLIVLALNAHAQQQNQQSGKRQKVKQKPQQHLDILALHQNESRDKPNKRPVKVQKFRYVTKDIPELGRVRGRTSTTEWSGKSIIQFLDIPYAKAPVGALRFKPPQPMEPWQGILNAYKSHVGCPSSQDLYNFETWRKKKVDFEDCLRLSVSSKSFAKIHALVPYSESESNISIDDETCVGNRGFKKSKVIRKKPQNKSRKSNGVKPNPCLNKNCGNSCADKFTESDRVAINEHFWGMGNKIRQRDWILSCTTRKCIKRRKSESNKRKWSFEYTISFNDIKAKVCQKFLLHTLNVSQNMIIYTRKNAQCIQTTKEANKNLKPYNKSDENKVALLKSFITQLPAVPSHYCRNKSSKLYLPSEFKNISTLYKYYLSHLSQINKESSKLSLRVFRKIFNTDFHIGFHMPKKDKCALCEKFKNSDSETKILLRQTEEFQKHLKDKETSKQIFLNDQKQGRTDSSFLCASFDLQKVLNTPHSKSVNLFYSRKYAYYNESIYESVTRNGYCFLWGEKDGKRGCNETCTVIFKYLKLLDKKGTYTFISLYCDSCAGQNRNRAMLAMFVYFFKSCTNIKSLKITFLLPGHTMMPVDSIHSTIESFTRQRNIWAPSEWYTVISNARTNPKNYECTIMEYSDFKDWKNFARTMFPTSTKIEFNSLRSAMFQKDSSLMTLKHVYCNNSQIKEYNLASMGQSKRKRNISISNEGPLSLYDKPLKISLKKFNDLKKLCEKGAIPKQFHNEYLNMQQSATITDELPETDEEDTF